jgi:uncharacterized protein YcsI (UPF0317 family)
MCHSEPHLFGAKNLTPLRVNSAKNLATLRTGSVKGKNLTSLRIIFAKNLSHRSRQFLRCFGVPFHWNHSE